MKNPELPRAVDAPAGGAYDTKAPQTAPAQLLPRTSATRQAELDAEDSTRMAYSRLAMRLERDLLHDEHGASVLIMAADYERVAVEASTELAWHFAEDLGRRVLLVDGSFGHHGLSKALGGQHDAGLQDVLSGRVALDSAVRRTAHPTISFLPCGGQTASQGPAARAAALRQFLHEATSLCDFVLIQGPAVSRASRTLAFGPLVDAALLIALEGELPLSDLSAAQAILTECGAERVGLVLGAARARPGDNT
jgi:Mrp family chromosome partitioning ATPase